MAWEAIEYFYLSGGLGTLSSPILYGTGTHYPITDHLALYLQCPGDLTCFDSVASLLHFLLLTSNLSYTDQTAVYLHRQDLSCNQQQ